MKLTARICILSGLLFGLAIWLLAFLVVPRHVADTSGGDYIVILHVAAWPVVSLAMALVSGAAALLMRVPWARTFSVGAASITSAAVLFVAWEIGSHHPSSSVADFRIGAALSPLGLQLVGIGVLAAGVSLLLLFRGGDRRPSRNGAR